MIILSNLKYEMGDLEPFISRETLEFHHNKHHKAYVDNLNNLIIGTEHEGQHLEEIIKTSNSGGIFNNAAQVWNHTFYFDQFIKGGNNISNGDLAYKIKERFGSFDSFKEEFNKMAISNFGSGWTWLIEKAGDLEIVNTQNASNPLLDDGVTPLLTCDVWEHAYYIDYRNRRAEYLDNFWKIINWEAIEERLN